MSLEMLRRSARMSLPCARPAARPRWRASTRRAFSRLGARLGARPRWRASTRRAFSRLGARPRWRASTRRAFSRLGARLVSAAKRAFTKSRIRRLPRRLWPRRGAHKGRPTARRVPIKSREVTGAGTGAARPGTGAASYRLQAWAPHARTLSESSGYRTFVRRSGHVRSGHVRSGQVRSGHVRSNLVGRLIRAIPEKHQPV